MRKLIVLAMVLVLIASLCVPSFAGLKKEYKLSINVSDATPWGKGAAKFAELVKERTDGKVNIKVYWSSQLFAGKATNELFILRNGVADFSVSSLINWAPQFPKGNLFLLPWFISSMPDKYKALDAVTHGKAGEMLNAELGKMGIEIFGWGEQGARELTNNVHSIKTPEDIKDLKIRVVGSPLFIDIFTAIGANPMNIAWTEAITALQQNVVDGQENPINAIILPYKIYEFQKYLTEWSYTMDPLVYAANRKVWNSFPSDIQQIIRECAEEAGRYNIALARLGLDNGESLEYLKKINAVPENMKDPFEALEEYGVTVTRLSAEDIKVFRKMVEPVYEKWVDKIGPDLVKAAEEDMASVNY